MHVALDVRTIQARYAGDRIYLENLIRHLGRLPEISQLSLYGEARLGDPVPVEGYTKTEAKVFRASRGWLWTPVAVPQQLKRDQADVFHAPYLVPSKAPCPTVATVHDVTLRLFPQYNRPRIKAGIRNLVLNASARSATAVITDSEHSRRDLIRVVRVRPDRIHVIPLAAGEHFTPGDVETARRRVRELLGLDRPFVLAVGWSSPHKNVPRLLEAVGSLTGSVGRELAVVVVGHPGAHTAESLHESFPALEGRLFFTHWISNDDLVAYYRAARLFAFPSLYEGFGLPVLEAMACGTPVVTSNSSSIPEVAGDAAILVEPRDTAALAAAVEGVASDEALREDLRGRGLEQAARFSWDRTAQMTLEVYKHVLGQ